MKTEAGQILERSQRCPTGQVKDPREGRDGCVSKRNAARYKKQQRKDVAKEISKKTKDSAMQDLEDGNIGGAIMKGAISAVSGKYSKSEAKQILEEDADYKALVDVFMLEPDDEGPGLLMGEDFNLVSPDVWNKKPHLDKGETYTSGELYDDFHIDEELVESLIALKMIKKV
jgi:hypothetical protein